MMTRSAQPRMKKDIAQVSGGVLLAIIGILCLVFPRTTLTIISILVGAVFLCMGIVGLVEYSKLQKAGQPASGVLVSAIAKLIIGLLFLLYPFILANIIPWLIGIAVGVVGIWQIGTAVQFRKAGAPYWWTGILSAVLTIICAILMLIYPAWLAWLLGIFAIVRGISMAIDGYFTSEIVYE